MPNYINPTPNPNLPLYPTIQEFSYLQGAIGNIQQQIDDLSNGGGGGGGVTTGDLTESTSNVLNIVGGVNAVVGSGTSIEVEKADATTDGYLSATDWNTFNSKEPALAKGNLSESVSSVLTISGGTNAVIGSGASIEVKQASGTQSGYLASTDFNTFNGKQDSLVSGTNIKTINGNSLLGSGDLTIGGGGGGFGYTLSVQALTSSPADNATIYFGQLPKAPVTTANISKVYIPKDGTITRVTIYIYSGTAGSNQSWSGYIRLNNTTDTLIDTLSVSTNERVFSNASLNIPVVVGDYFEIKFINPTWSTNPLTTIFGGYIYIE